jgi:hypothetical protein
MLHTIILFIFSLSYVLIDASPLRYEMPLENSTGIYYIEQPTQHASYTLLLVVEGSYCEEKGPQSVKAFISSISATYSSGYRSGMYGKKRSR